MLECILFFLITQTMIKYPIYFDKLHKIFISDGSCFFYKLQIALQWASKIIDPFAFYTNFLRILRPCMFYVSKNVFLNHFLACLFLASTVIHLIITCYKKVKTIFFTLYKKSCQIFLLQYQMQKYLMRHIYKDHFIFVFIDP